jgi:predicted hydrocarbon binding protein
MAPGKLRLHERIEFDVAAGRIQDGPRRYLMMRTDVLMGTFDGLPPAARAQALAALGQAVFAIGGDSARAYLAEVGADAFLAAMTDGAASLGWGRWHFEQAPASLRLVVHDSPFAAGTRERTGTACHAITGMLRAVASALWSRPVDARESRCACDHPARDVPCLFVATPLAVPLPTAATDALP